ncbi:MAG TPA: integrase core domain-containing protein [Gemmatirosa sp.]
MFERLFRTYGLPTRIRSDTGVPVATAALGRRSARSAWGITPELIEPSSPQQNGQHERMHRTRKAEATRPARASLAAQQRRFAVFRMKYNDERPHAALGNDPPADRYAPSPRAYPARLPEPEYPGHFEVRYVSRDGGVRWHNRWVNVSHVRAEEYVGLEEIDDGIWSVYFDPVLLGRVDERDLTIHGAHNRNKQYRRSTTDP